MLCVLIIGCIRDTINSMNRNWTTGGHGMKKQIAILLFGVMFLFSLAGCVSKYSSYDFIGKTSVEIEAEFGTFDCYLMPASEDGLYRNTACGYTIKEPKVNFLGADPEVLFFITFDEDGMAISCEEGYRPGG